MTHAEFDTILDRRLSLTRGVLATKAGEYASTADRLHNFKRSAAITGETPTQVCVGFFVKHLTSVLDIVDGVSGGKIYPPAVVDEKLGDLFNYIVLLEALITETSPRPGSG